MADANVTPFDFNNFIVDRIVRGSMTSPNTGDILWTITQIKEPTLKCTGESVDAVDALGTPIMSFDRSKKAEFSANNSIFDLGLAAAQFGSTKSVASLSNKIKTPKFETITVKTSDTEVTLSKVPVGVKGSEIKQIYALNGDSTLGKKYVIGASASATEFVLAITDDVAKITLPTGLADNTRLLIRYEYEATGAVEIANDANKFPTAGQFIMEVLGSQPCDKETKYSAYIVMPNAKLTTNVDISFTTEGNHPFTLMAMQDYCDPENRLFRIVVPEL